MPPDFTHRADLTELMDEPCSYEEFRACVEDIAQINRLTLSYRPTLAFLERAHCPRHRQITVATLVSQALVHPVARPFIALVSRLFSSALTKLAGATRIPADALLA